VVFTILKMIRPLFRYNRALLGDLCMVAVTAMAKYMKAYAERDLMPGVAAVIQTFGNRLNFHPHLHMLITEGGSVKPGAHGTEPRGE
jgi:hypothetical protein